jgi:Methyltransferase domain
MSNTSWILAVDQVISSLWHYFLLSNTNYIPLALAVFCLCHFNTKLSNCHITKYLSPPFPCYSELIIGNMTKHLCNAFPNAKITGVDSSPQMIEAARSEYIHYSSDPKFTDRVDFKLDTIENYVFTNKSQKYDVVYSNATLHWIPSSYHSVLFPQIISNVMKKNNSILAIQMPDTKNQQSHLLMETGQYFLSFSRMTSMCMTLLKKAILEE